MDIFNIVLNSLKELKKHPKLLLPALLLLLFSIAVLSFASWFFLSAIPGQVISNHPLYTRILLAITRIIPMLVTVGLIVFLAGVLVKGMYIDLSYNLKKYPKRPSLRHSFRISVSRYKDLLLFEIIAAVISLFIALITIGPVLLMAQNSIILPYLNNVVISASSYLSFSLIATILVLVFVILYIMASILLWLGPSIVVLDGSDARSALGACVTLGRREPIRIFGILVITCLVCAIALLLSNLFQIIPILGVVISFIISIGIISFIELIPPMYYLGFHKK